MQTTKMNTQSKKRGKNANRKTAVPDIAGQDKANPIATILSVAMMFRYYGNYETGVCFAILAMNAFSGWLDRAVLRILHRKGVVRREL